MQGGGLHSAPPTLSNHRCPCCARATSSTAAPSRSCLAGHHLDLAIAKHAATVVAKRTATTARAFRPGPAAAPSVGPTGAYAARVVGPRVATARMTIATSS